MIRPFYPVLELGAMYIAALNPNVELVCFYVIVCVHYTLSLSPVKIRTKTKKTKTKRNRRRAGKKQVLLA